MSNMSQIIKKIVLITIALVLVNCSEDPIEIFDTGTLTGIVVAKGSNTPLENVKISTNPNFTTVFTDVDGYFIIEEIPTNQYSVQAELDGYLSAFEAAEITDGSSINVIFE